MQINVLGSPPQTFAHYLHIGNKCLPHFYDRLGERITYHKDANSIDGIISYLSIYAYYGDLAGELIMPQNLAAFIHISYLEKVARIDDIYVAPEYRNRGIATELLNIAIQTASSDGYERTIGVLSNKPGFKAFFTKRGYYTHIFNDRKKILVLRSRTSTSRLFLLRVLGKNNKREQTKPRINAGLTQGEFSTIL